MEPCKEKSMHQAAKFGRAVAALAIAIGAAAIPGVSMADQPAPETASVQTVTASGTIQKIDKDNHVVTIKGDMGNTVDVKVGPNVAMDKLKVGQRVNAAYYEEVALALRKPGEQAPKMTQTTTERGGITAQQTTVTAKVVAVDTAANKLILMGPQGNKHSVEVNDPDLQAQLGKIKAGDSLEVTYTQAVAVALEPIK
jgi:Cu/Ag efflux protein CusF